MKVTPASLDGVLIVEPAIFGDDRGYFMESWKASSYAAVGISAPMVQSNFSRSSKGVLRGLHYQYPRAQGKLVCAVEGAIYDVAVDIRKGSPGFGHWTGVELSAANHRQLYVPAGFAHGFCVLSDTALVHYLCTEEFAQQYDASIAWNDPDIAVKWPMEPLAVSDKDSAAPSLSEIPGSQLPRFEP